MIDDRRYHSSRKRYLPVHVICLKNRDRVLVFDNLENRDAPTLSQFLELATKDVIHLQLLGDFPGNIHTMGADFSPGGILGKANP